MKIRIHTNDYLIKNDSGEFSYLDSYGETIALGDAAAVRIWADEKQIFLGQEVLEFLHPGYVIVYASSDAPGGVKLIGEVEDCSGDYPETARVFGSEAEAKAYIAEREPLLDAGNIKPVKPDKKYTGKRIDGVVASIMALDRASVLFSESSVYESRGVRAI